MAIPISGRTGLYCVFGDPVQHSFSPRLHNKAFQKANIDGVYVAFTVNKETIEASNGRSSRSWLWWVQCNHA